MQGKFFLQSEMIITGLSSSILIFGEILVYGKGNQIMCFNVKKRENIVTISGQFIHSVVFLDKYDKCSFFACSNQFDVLKLFRFDKNYNFKLIGKFDLECDITVCKLLRIPHTLSPYYIALSNSSSNYIRIVDLKGSFAKQNWGNSIGKCSKIAKSMNHFDSLYVTGFLSSLVYTGRVYFCTFYQEKAKLSFKSVIENGYKPSCVSCFSELSSTEPPYDVVVVGFIEFSKRKSGKTFVRFYIPKIKYNSIQLEIPTSKEPHSLLVGGRNNLFVGESDGTIEIFKLYKDSLNKKSRKYKYDWAKLHEFRFSDLIVLGVSDLVLSDVKILSDESFSLKILLALDFMGNGIVTKNEAMTLLLSYSNGSDLYYPPSDAKIGQTVNDKKNSLNAVDGVLQLEEELRRTKELLDVKGKQNKTLKLSLLELKMKNDQDSIDLRKALVQCKEYERMIRDKDSELAIVKIDNDFKMKQLKLFETKNSEIKRNLNISSERNQNIQTGIEIVFSVPEMISKLSEANDIHEAMLFHQQIIQVLASDKKFLLEIDFIPVIRKCQNSLKKMLDTILEKIKSFFTSSCFRFKDYKILMVDAIKEKEDFDLKKFGEVFKKLEQLDFIGLEKEMVDFSSFSKIFEVIEKKYLDFHVLLEKNEDTFKIRFLKSKLFGIINKLGKFKILINRMKKRRIVIIEIDKPLVIFMCSMLQREKEIVATINELKDNSEEFYFEEMKNYLKISVEIFKKEKEFQKSRNLLNSKISKKSVVKKSEIESNVILVKNGFKDLNKKYEEFHDVANSSSQLYKKFNNRFKMLEKKSKKLFENLGKFEKNVKTFKNLVSTVEEKKLKEISKLCLVFSVKMKERLVEEICSKVFKLLPKIHQKMQNISEKINETFRRSKRVFFCEEMKKEATISVLKSFSNCYEIGESIIHLQTRVKDYESKLKKIESELMLKSSGKKDDEIFGFSFEEDDEEELEGENDEIVKEKQKVQKEMQLEQKKLKEKKREQEKHKRIIYVEGRNTLDFLKNKVSTIKGNIFVSFLRNQGVYVERTLSDYSKLKTLHSNFGDVHFGILEADFAEIPKIIKVLDYSPECELMIQNEIKCLLKLKEHHSIIPVNAVFIFEDEKFKTEKIGIEMDYYKTDLFRWLKGYSFTKKFKGELKEHETIRSKKQIYKVFRKLLEGIAFFHSKGIQHRDLKPDNVLLNSELEVKIIDFGIARDQKLTLTRRNLGGTLRYLSEQDRKSISNNKKIEGLTNEDYEKRDIYSFGLMLLESLCPKEVYEDIYDSINRISAEDFFEKHNEKILWKGKFRLAIEEMNVIRRLLDPDPKRRISSKEALKCDLFKLELQKGITEKEFDVEKLIRVKNIDLIRERINSLYSSNKPRNKNLITKLELDRRFVGKENERRKSILDDFFNQSMKRCSNLEELLIPFKVTFVGEKADDAGGVTRELCSLVFEEILLTKCHPVGKYYLPSSCEDFSDIFFSLGKFFLKCLLEKRTFRIPFGPLFYSFLLFQEPRKDKDWIKYCKLYDKEYVEELEKSLFDSKIFNEMKKNEDTFYNRENLECFLTEENKGEFFSCNILQKLKGDTCTRIDKNILSFKKGFNSFIPEKFQIEMVSLLNPFELEKLVYGDKKITKEIVLKNLEFVGFKFVPKYLEFYLSNCSEKKLWDFILYCCGCCDLISEKLYMNGGIKKILVIREDFGDPKRNSTIMSFTCAFTLKIGKNFDKENKFNEFKERLNWVLENYKTEGMADD